MYKPKKPLSGKPKMQENGGGKKERKKKEETNFDFFIIWLR